MEIFSLFLFLSSQLEITEMTEDEAEGRSQAGFWSIELSRVDFLSSEDPFEEFKIESPGRG